MLAILVMMPTEITKLVQIFASGSQKIRIRMIVTGTEPPLWVDDVRKITLIGGPIHVQENLVKQKARELRRMMSGIGDFTRVVSIRTIEKVRLAGTERIGESSIKDGPVSKVLYRLVIMTGYLLEVTVGATVKSKMTKTGQGRIGWNRILNGLKRRMKMTRSRFTPKKNFNYGESG